MAAIEPEVEQFANAVRAINLRELRAVPSLPEIESFAAKFKRQSYFVLNSPPRILICKISRTQPPFWDVKRITLSDIESGPIQEYFLVLLLNSHEGYAFRPSDVKYFVEQKKWRLANDDRYKINPPIPETYAFHSPDQFLSRFHNEMA